MAQHTDEEEHQHGEDLTEDDDDDLLTDSQMNSVSEDDDEQMSVEQQNEDEYFDDSSNSNEEEDAGQPDLHQLILKAKRIISKLNRHKPLLHATHEALLDEIEENFEQYQLDERFATELSQLSNRKRISLTSLKKVIPIRWYTLNNALKSLVASLNTVNSALIELGSVRLTITPAESSLIKVLIQHLNELEKFSKTCTTDQVLDSTFLAALIELKSFFDVSLDQQYSFDAIIDFRTRFRANVDRRIEVKKQHVIGFLLDPQTKHSPLLDSYLERFTDDGQASTLLYEELIRIHQSAPEEPSTHQATSSVSNSASRRLRIESLEQERNISSQNHLNLRQEIAVYLASPRLDLEVTEYWARKQDSALFKLFLKNSCIQVTSNKSEQTWSRASLINSKKRAKLLARNLRSTIFINVNYKLCRELELQEIPLTDQSQRAV